MARGIIDELRDRYKLKEDEMTELEHLKQENARLKKLLQEAHHTMGVLNQHLTALHEKTRLALRQEETV